MTGKRTSPLDCTRDSSTALDDTIDTFTSMSDTEVPECRAAGGSSVAAPSAVCAAPPLLTGPNGRSEVLSLAVLAARAVPIAALTAQLQDAAAHAQQHDQYELPPPAPQYEDISAPSSPLAVASAAEQPVDLSLPQRRVLTRPSVGVRSPSAARATSHAGHTHGKPDSYKVRKWQPIQCASLYFTVFCIV